MRYDTEHDTIQEASERAMRYNEHSWADLGDERLWAQYWRNDQGWLQGEVEGEARVSGGGGGGGHCGQALLQLGTGLERSAEPWSGHVTLFTYFRMFCKIYFGEWVFCLFVFCLFSV